MREIETIRMDPQPGDAVVVEVGVATSQEQPDVEAEEVPRHQHEETQSTAHLLEDATPGADRLTRWLAQQPFEEEQIAGSNATAPPFPLNEDDGIVEEFLGVDTQLRDHLRQRRKTTRLDVYDTRRYTTPDYPLWHHTAHKLELHKSSQQKRVRAISLLLKMAMAFTMSVVGFAIAQSAEGLLKLKNDTATDYLENGNGYDTTRSILAFVFWISVNLFLGLLASLPVLLWRPMSAGSGIAEAKAVLNGIQLEGCTQPSTAFCKGISVICSSAASLPVGLEGPMIFIGLALGDNVVNVLLVQMPRLLGLPQSRTLKAAKEVFQMDKHKRDLQAIGTACGVTSAFASPIGGVLFAMEEGCSYWSYELAWRSFTAACVTAIFTYLWSFLLSLGRGEQAPGMFLPDNVVSKFESAPSHQQYATSFVSFRMIDYLAFAGMGVAGGIIGACWCEANRSIAIARAKWHVYRASRVAKCLEVLFLVAITSTVLWWLPQIYTVCTVEPNLSEEYQTAGCGGGEYNQLATLFWNPTATVGINLLFWETAQAFSAGVCIVAGTVTLVLLLLLFGSSIAMGIFIPLLFVGACYGRAFGMAIGPEVVTTYAIVGSVAMLAGVTRVFISLCVIMVTATGQPHLITPFMIATIVARATGRAVFGREGIYDIILELKHIPFLEELPADHIMYRGLKAKDVMSSLPATLEPEETVENLLECLRKCDSLHDIPVIDTTREGVLIGKISKSYLLTILSQNQLFYEKGENVGKATTCECLEHLTENKQTLESVEGMISEHDLQLVVDLTPYTRIAPDTVHLLASAERTYNVFRTLGLRNLIVTDLTGRPVGIVTRNDLHRLEEDGTVGDEGKEHSGGVLDNRPLAESFSFMS